MMAEAEFCDTSTPVYYSSNRGGTKLKFKGFVYNKDRTIESKINWRCEDRKCKGRIVMVKILLKCQLTQHMGHANSKQRYKNL